MLNYPQKRQKQPDSFIDFISVAPHREDNALVGYRVSPGRNPSLFQAVGLESGDIITQINGLDVTDPEQTMEAMGALRSSSSIELTVSREGELMTLYLELPEPTDV
jgi:general secretion pathway protein C